MKNTNKDLDNYLFEMIERLNDDDLQGEELEKEMKKAGAINELATTIIQNRQLALKAQGMLLEYGLTEKVDYGAIGIGIKDESKNS